MCAKVVAITGSPGTGKSTLAKQLTDLGFQVRTIETIALEVERCGAERAAGAKA